MLFRGNIFFWLKLNILQCLLDAIKKHKGLYWCVLFVPGIVSFLVDAMEILVLFLPTS